MSVLLRVISDTHIGSPLGVWPAEGMVYAREEQKMDLTPAQEFLWQKWKDVARLPKPDIIVLNGDLIGADAGQPLDIIQRAAVVTFRKVLKKDTHLYLIRGTPYHEKYYEALVEGLEPKPNPEGGYVGDFVEFVIHGKRLNIAHHPEGSSGAIYKGTILGKSSVWAAVASMSGKVKMPDVIVRSHLHFYATYEDDLCTVVHTPCFSFQSSYARKKSYYRLQPDIGVVDLEIPENGRVRVLPRLFPIPQLEGAVIWRDGKK